MSKRGLYQPKIVDEHIQQLSMLLLMRLRYGNFGIQKKVLLHFLLRLLNVSPHYAEPS